MQASSTPDALWTAPSLRLLRPTAVECGDVARGHLLRGCSLTLTAGTRLLLVAEPDESASLLLRILAGLARPRRGRIRLAGLTDPTTRGWARRVAYLGPEPGIHPWMTPREALSLAAGLLELASETARRMEGAVAWARIPSAAMDRPVRRGGPALLERTGFAAALLADPEVLLLDEPLRSLDPHERTSMLRLPGSRLTMLLASRLPASETGLVGHVALLREGRVAYHAPVASVIGEGGTLSRRAIVEAATR